MEEIPDMNLCSSPNINSVLKPPKPRIPLKDIMSAVNDDDNTASRKRRVSFANVNKIKEFSAGAESMVVCHTPAYEEPFSVSSDSSCPGVEGFTPAKFNPAAQSEESPAMFYYKQKEDLVDRTLLLQNQFSLQSIPNCPESDCHINILKAQSNPLHKGGRLSVSKLQMPGVFLQSNNITSASLYSNYQSDEMDLTRCNNTDLRNVSRLSLGMDLTNVVGQSMGGTRYSSEGMDLTTVANSHQTFTDRRLSYMTDTNLIENEDMENSDSLDLTDAITDPKLTRVSTMCSVRDMELTGYVHSVNNTRNSVNGMDLTKAAISHRPSPGRRSTRYSVSNMDLTEALGNTSAIDTSAPKIISEPRTVMSTRYSVNEMDLTESVTNKDYNRFSTNTMYSSDIGELEYSADSETSMDFTKPIYNICQSTYDKEGLTELTGIGEELRSRKSTCYLADMDLTGTNNTQGDDKSFDKADVLKDSESFSNSFLDNNKVNNDSKEKIILHSGISMSENNIENKINNENKLQISEKEDQNVSGCEVIINQASGQMIDSAKDTKVNDNESVPENNIINMFSKVCNIDRTAAVSDESNCSKKDVTSKENNVFGEKPCGKDELIFTGNMSNHTETDSYSNKGVKENDSSIIRDNILVTQQIINVQNENNDLSQSLASNSVHISEKSVHTVDTEMFQCAESRKDVSEINVSVLLPDKNNFEKDATAEKDLILEHKQTYSHRSDILNLNSENTPKVNNETELQSNLDGVNVSVGVNTKNNINEEICENVDSERHENVDSEMHKNIQNEICKIVDSEKHDNVDGEIHENVHSGICETVDSERYEDVIESENNGCKSKEASEVIDVEYCCIANDSKQEHTRPQVNDTLTVDECEINKSVIQDNVIVKNIDLLQVSTDTLMNESTNDTICSKNITITRGGRRDYNTTFTVPCDLALETNIDRSMFHNAGKIKKVKYTPLNQDVETNNDTLNVSEIGADVLQVADLSNCKKVEKGGKRSFEMALGNENDTEESPVKQPCLLKTEHLADVEFLHDVTAPSFLMDTLNAPNETIPSVHNSSMASTLGKINSPIRNQVDKELPIRKIQSENKELEIVNVSCASEKGHFDGSVRSFSLRVDVSAQFENENDNHLFKQEEIHHVSVQITNTHTNPGRTPIQLKEESHVVNRSQGSTKLMSDSSFECAHILDSDDTKPQSCFSLPSPLISSSNGFNTVEKIKIETRNSSLCNSKVTLDEESCSKGLVNDDVTRRLTKLLVEHNILSKPKTVRNLDGGTFACDLIPKWIDLQFCIDSNDSITSIDYKVACSERYHAIGDYLLHQVRRSVLPGPASNDVLLQLQGCRDKFQFLEQLARNLCAICKYHNGTLKGNILTVEVISCVKQLWMFVEINMKYPQDLCATDINISEQKFGQIKLSSLRNNFGSNQINPDQLFDFTMSLTTL